MEKNRLEAFSDGVIAIIITIMVLELHVPSKPDLSVLKEELLPVFLSYVLSFIYVGIYWNNHHHMLNTTRRVNGRILWANLHLLFWLSLFPFVTSWVSETFVTGGAGDKNAEAVPVAVYGAVLFMAGIAYLILQRAIIAQQGRDSLLARAIGRDLIGKASAVFYFLAILLSFVSVWIAIGLYVFVALLWLIPDPRIERMLEQKED